MTDNGLERTRTELLPCPFCGEVYVAHVEGHVKVTETAKSGPRFGVNCYRCGGRIQFFKFKEQAIEAWNTRVQASTTCGEGGGNGDYKTH